MYDVAFTQTQIDAEIAHTAAEPDPARRFLGIRHSIEEAQLFIDHMNSLLDDNGRPKRKLTAKEQQWVKNERVLSMLDFEYWASRYGRIVNDSNVMVPFVPRIAQRMVINVWAELERLGWAIMMIQLKARQLGVTTLTELAILHRNLFYPDLKSVVASCDEDKSKLMARMIEACLEEQPWWLVPDFASHKIGRYLEFTNHSLISVESGNQMSGIAMGNTPQCAHISELSDFFDASLLIDASLLHAVHPHAQTFVVLESTAKGFDNWWYKKWTSSVRNWQKGTAKLCPIFLPWFVGRDIYPTDTWVRMHPIPRGWIPSEKTEKHAEKAAIYVKTNDRLHTVFGDGWTLPRVQQWFYEVSYQEAVEEKRLPTFLSEMPADPDEAFQSTNIAAVDLEDLLPHRDRALAREPVVVFGITGDTNEIPVRHQPSRRMFDPKATIAPVTVRTLLGPTISEYTLYPLRFESYDEDPHGRLYVWEWPKDNETYAIGVDMGDGVGQDRSVIQVVKKISVWDPWKQVAEFATPFMNSFDFWPIVQAVLLLYSVRRGESIRQPRIVIEIRGNGENVQLELKKRGWTNFHQWTRYDGKKIDPSKAHVLGILTNPWFRRMMMDKILSIFNNQEIDLGSPWLIEEFRRLERDEYKQQFRADGGGHDDRVMALGFCLWSLDILELHVRSRRRVDQADLEASDEPTYTDRQSFAGGGLPQSYVAKWPKPKQHRVRI